MAVDRAPLEDRKSFVYFIQAGDTGPVKIGTARDPEVRRLELQCGNAEELVVRRVVKGSYAFETRLHATFHDLRMKGEWFRPEPCLLRAMMLPNLEELHATSSGRLDEYERWAWEMRPDKRAVGKDSHQDFPLCGVCGVNLHVVYGDDYASETDCQACIDAASYRETEAA